MNAKTKKSRAWRQKKYRTGQCMATTLCREPRGRYYYCAYHRRRFLEKQNVRRGLHRRLGFCLFCLNRAEPGQSRCRRHLKANAESHQRWRDKAAKARGWKWVKVNIA